MIVTTKPYLHKRHLTAGWALVRVRGERCSSQTVVTRCTHYNQFTTEEALREAAASYGGLMKDI